MNKRFEEYVQALTPSNRLLAKEAVEEYLKGEGETQDVLNTSMAIYNKVRHLALEKEEHSYVVLMKQNFRFIGLSKISDGCMTNCYFDVRVVIREALLNNAIVIALAHNHPSGSTHPSKEDDAITSNIRKCCEMMRIHLVDHIIVGDGGYYSYKDNYKL